VVEAEGLAYAPTHEHAVYGVTQAFLGHGYEEGHRGVGAASAVAPCHYAERVAQTRKICPACAKELFYSAGGA